jgi:Cytochrome P450
MILYPDFQKRAQEEIDQIIGQDRVPTHDDLASLPYVRACWKESKRWRPALPLGTGVNLHSR